MSVSPAPHDPAPPPRSAYWQLAALGGLLVWAYWPMLGVFADKWTNDPQYSHGFLVPFFSGYLLWKAWQAHGPLAAVPRPLLGGLVLAVVVLLRLVSGSILFHQLDALTFLLGLFGVALAAGGFPLVKRAWPAVLFLVFMVPLPYEVERNVGQPMKNAATVSSTFLLQTLGQPALRDGNLILIGDKKLGVEDACNGLKMMMTFAAFSVGAVLLTTRTRFEKFLVLLGVIPIAVVVNVLRVTATGLAHVWVDDPKTFDVLHDAFGWLMMPVGLALLGLELWVLGRLVIDEPPADGLPHPAFAVA